MSFAKCSIDHQFLRAAALFCAEGDEVDASGGGVSELGNDAVAELHGALGLDAENVPHLIGAAPFDNQLEDTEFVRTQHFNVCFDIVEQAGPLGFGQGVVQGLVERDQGRRTAEEAAPREGAAALPAHPQRFLLYAGAATQRVLALPQIDVAFLPQFGTEMVVAQCAAHAHAFDKSLVPLD